MTHHYEPRPPTETRESDYIFQDQNRVFRQHNILHTNYYLHSQAKQLIRGIKQRYCGITVLCIASCGKNDI